MKITIPIISDSFNSYPNAELEFDIHQASVSIKIKDEDDTRKISISSTDFFKNCITA